MSAPDPAIEAVRNVLSRLRKRSGLRERTRLRATEIDASALLALPAVAAYAERHDTSAEAAVLPLLRELAERLDPTDRLIVDAELVLTLFADAPPPSIDPARLYAGDLGVRRAYLVEHWHALHRALRADPGSTPTVRSLRLAPERRAFTALATLLVDGRPDTRPAPAPPDPTRPTVTVVGDAVLDHLYRVGRIPQAGNTVSGSMIEHPGGKGLTRAVAAARLGLHARLVAAVGDDDTGDRVLAYLSAEGVDTAFVKRVPNTPTSVTALIVTPTGERAHIPCKDPRLDLSVEDLDDPAVRAALTTADAVLLNFEHAPPVIERVLAEIGALPDPPVLIVHVAPPLARPQLLYGHLGAITFLVGSPTELAMMLPDSHAVGADPVQQLRMLGIETVCTLQNFGVSVRGATLDVDIPPLPALLTSSPGAHAAFSAALAYRVINSGVPVTETDFRFAAAAMIATQSLDDVPGAMPDLDRIHRILTIASEEH
ncbi:PfkB family carbohydrate kinase [Nocardia sp. NPDC003482]